LEHDYSARWIFRDCETCLNIAKKCSTDDGIKRLLLELVLKAAAYEHVEFSLLKTVTTFFLRDSDAMKYLSKKAKPEVPKHVRLFQSPQSFYFFRCQN
jgi:hypothetical protein